MASSLDYQKIWDSYQGIVKTKDISIVDYCQRNGIVYSQFERWYKKYVSNVHIIPVSEKEPQVQDAVPATVAKEEKDIPKKKPIVEYVSLSFSNGLKVNQKSLDYDQLKLLVEKLEALC